MKNLVKIDSLRIIIDKSLIKSVDVPATYLITEHSEIIKSFKQKSGVLEIEDKNKHTASVYYLIHTFKLKGHIEEQMKFIIMCSAKLEGKNYLKTGLTLETVKEVLQILKNKGILTLKAYNNEIFKQIQIKDLDLCMDFVTPGYLTEKLLKSYQLSLKPNASKLLGRGDKLTLTKKAQMLQVNRREQSTYAKPFVKIYNKSLEFIEKTKRGNETIYLKYAEQFNKDLAYEIIRVKPQLDINMFSDNKPIKLEDFDTDSNVYSTVKVGKKIFMRFEVTIRNYIDFDRYKLNHNLYDVFNSSQKIRNNIFNNIMDKVFYLNNLNDNFNNLDNPVTTREPETYSPSETVTILLIQDLLKHQDVGELELNRYLTYMPNPTAKTRMKRKLIKLIFAAKAQINYDIDK